MKRQLHHLEWPQETLISHDELFQDTHGLEDIDTMMRLPEDHPFRLRYFKIMDDQKEIDVRLAQYKQAELNGFSLAIKGHGAVKLFKQYVKKKRHPELISEIDGEPADTVDKILKLQYELEMPRLAEMTDKILYCGIMLTREDLNRFKVEALDTLETLKTEYARIAEAADNPHQERRIAQTAFFWSESSIIFLSHQVPMYKELRSR